MEKWKGKKTASDKSVKTVHGAKGQVINREIQLNSINKEHINIQANYKAISNKWK